MHLPYDDRGKDIEVGVGVFSFDDFWDLTDVGTIKIIYSAFARSILEYSSVVWDPTTQVSINKIEKIQKSFLKYLFFRAFSYYPIDTTYNELLAGFEISSLQNRRKLAKLLFFVGYAE